jgi:methyltransferase (TIGR00027 family)
MSRSAAQTGPGAMALVAIEQGFESGERILTDELSGPILPSGSRFWVRLLRPVCGWIVTRTEAKVPGLWGGIMARKRYIDDALAEFPTAAVVNLGAGFDTRAYRLAALADVPVWEVDQAGSVESKRSRLHKILGGVPEHVTLVPVDFDREDLGTALAAAGHPPESVTFFILEGVTQYLSEAGFEATFGFLAGAAPGSRLIFTYTPRDFIDGAQLYGQPHLRKKMLGRNPLWHFGLDPDEVDGVLARFGWRTVEHLGYDELDERYVKPAGRELGWMAIERIVHGRKP